MWYLSAKNVLLNLFVVCLLINNFFKLWKESALMACISDKKIVLYIGWVKIHCKLGQHLSISRSTASLTMEEGQAALARHFYPTTYEPMSPRPKMLLLGYSSCNQRWQLYGSVGGKSILLPMSHTCTLLSVRTQRIHSIQRLKLLD